MESGIIKLKTFGGTPLRRARKRLSHGRGGSKARKLFEWLLLSGYLTWESLLGLLWWVSHFYLLSLRYCRLAVLRLIFQSCPTLCNPMDCSLPGSSGHGILQARILEWVAIYFFRGSTWLGEIQPTSLASPALAGGFFTTEPPGKAQVVNLTDSQALVALVPCVHDHQKWSI